MRKEEVMTTPLGNKTAEAFLRHKLYVDDLEYVYEPFEKLIEAAEEYASTVAKEAVKEKEKEIIDLEIDIRMHLDFSKQNEKEIEELKARIVDLDPLGLVSEEKRKADLKLRVEEEKKGSNEKKLFETLKKVSQVLELCSNNQLAINEREDAIEHLTESVAYALDQYIKVKGEVGDTEKTGDDKLITK